MHDLVVLRLDYGRLINEGLHVQRVSLSSELLAVKEEIRKVEVTHDEDDAQILASSHVPLPQGTELPSDRLIGRSKRLLQVLKVVFGADVEFADGQVGHEPLAEDEARSECEYLVAGVFVAKEREFIE